MSHSRLGGLLVNLLKTHTSLVFKFSAVDRRYDHADRPIGHDRKSLVFEMERNIQGLSVYDNRLSIYYSG